MSRAIDDPAFTLTVAVHDGRVHVVRKSGDPKTTRSALLRDYAHFQREFYVYLRELLELEAAGAIPRHLSAELVLAVNDEVLAHDYCAGAACPAIGRYTTKRDRAAGTGSPEVIVPGWDYAYWNFDVRFHSLIDMRGGSRGSSAATSSSAGTRRTPPTWRGARWARPT